MKRDSFISSFECCITSLNLSHFLNDLEGGQFLLLDKDSSILKALSINKDSVIFTKKYLIEDADCKKMIKTIKIRRTSIKNILSSEKIAMSSAIQKHTGEIIGYLIFVCKDSKKELLVFTEMLCSQIFYVYQIELINSIFSKYCTFFNNLKEKEIKILELICEGRNDKSISKKLHLSLSSVRKYIENMFNTVNVENRTQLCCLYYNFIVNTILHK